MSVPLRKGAHSWLYNPLRRGAGGLKDKSNGSLNLVAVLSFKNMGKDTRLSKPDHLEGGCLCRAIRYEIEGPFSNVAACHCSQCARWTGHLYASFTGEKNKLKIQGEKNIGWYQSSEQARRGFCKTCGSSLFWERINATETDILAGSLDRSPDQPTGLKTTRHIYVADKGDYYEIGDDVAQFPQYGKDPEAE